jgi:hypothetical protein
MQAPCMINSKMIGAYLGFAPQQLGCILMGFYFSQIMLVLFLMH